MGSWNIDAAWYWEPNLDKAVKRAVKSSLLLVTWKREAIQLGMSVLS